MAFKWSNIWETLISLLRLNLLWLYVYGDDKGGHPDNIADRTSNPDPHTEAQGAGDTNKGAKRKQYSAPTIVESPAKWWTCLNKTQLKDLLMKHDLPAEGNTQQLINQVARAVNEGLIDDPLPRSESPKQLPTERSNPQMGTQALSQSETRNLKEMLGLPPTATFCDLQRALISATRREHETESHEARGSIVRDTSIAAQPQMMLNTARTTVHPSHGNTEHFSSPDNRSWGDNTQTVDTATLCNVVRKWNLRFDGRRHSDAVSFIERLHELMEVYDIPRDGILKVLPELLKDTALLWYRNNKDFWSNFTHFLRDFQLQYLPGDYWNQLNDEINRRTQGEGELFRQYVVSISTLIRRRGGLSEHEKLEKIYSNMHPSYKMYVRRRDFNNLQGLVALAEEYETCLRERQKFKPPPGPAQALVAETAYQGKNRNSYQSTFHTAVVSNTDQVPIQHPRGNTIKGGEDTRWMQHQPTIMKDRKSPEYSRREKGRRVTENDGKVCWNCGAVDHLYKDCPKPKILKCFNCKRPNMRTISCGCWRSENKNRTWSPPKTRLTTSTEWDKWVEKVRTFCNPHNEVERDDPRPFLDIKVSGKTYKALIDTGSVVTLINEQVAQHLTSRNVRTHEVECKISMANRLKVPVTKVFTFEAEISGNKHTILAAYLPKLTAPIVLGMDVIKLLNLVTINTSDPVFETSCTGYINPPELARRSLTGEEVQEPEPFLAVEKSTSLAHLEQQMKTLKDVDMNEQRHYPKKARHPNNDIAHGVNVTNTSWYNGMFERARSHSGNHEGFAVHENRLMRRMHKRANPTMDSTVQFKLCIAEEKENDTLRQNHFEETASSVEITRPELKMRKLDSAHDICSPTEGETQKQKKRVRRIRRTLKILIPGSTKIQRVNVRKLGLTPYRTNEMPPQESSIISNI